LASWRALRKRVGAADGAKIEQDVMVAQAAL